ncbi:MAG: hypothetical protein HW412_1993 [Bacteroidetes bacterium]|nr:hypothetical protein [Bacteroidota bacterium]
MITSIRQFVAALMICYVAPVTGCNTNDPGAGQQAEPTYIPLISNAWIDVANANHTFLFVADSSNVPVGTFTGEERNGAANPDSLTGNFRNRNISFTVRRQAGNVTFNGRFIADTLIDCGTLRLFRTN